MLIPAGQDLNTSTLLKRMGFQSLLYKEFFVCGSMAVLFQAILCPVVLARCPGPDLAVAKSVGWSGSAPFLESLPCS